MAVRQAREAAGKRTHPGSCRLGEDLEEAGMAPTKRREGPEEIRDLLRLEACRTRAGSVREGRAQLRVCRRDGHRLARRARRGTVQRCQRPRDIGDAERIQGVALQRRSGLSCQGGQERSIGEAQLAHGPRNAREGARCHVRFLLKDARCQSAEQLLELLVYIDGGRIDGTAFGKAV